MAADPRRRGAALLLTLAVLVLVEGLMAMALALTTARSRLVADSGEALDAMIVARSVIAEGRVIHAEDLRRLAEGEERMLGFGARADGWSWRLDADRRDRVIRLGAVVWRGGTGPPVRARGTSTLLLAADSADTVRVLMRAPRS